ncbi:hypothetical protein ACS0TY_030616 [Phlomoides rotata]
MMSLQYSLSTSSFPTLHNQFCKPNPSLLRSRLARCAADEQKNQIQLPGGLQQQLMPKHVAVIMDGNRRWAIERGLPAQHGHRAGRKAMKQLALDCSKYGVKVLSCFAFSTENWSRPQEEVEFLMNLAGEAIASDLEELIQKENMQVSYIGNRRQLSESLQQQLCESEEHGKSNTGMHLVVAFNYSGQYDIIEASRKIASKVRDGVLGAQAIDTSVFQKHLETNVAQFPNPDLMIRTSGEMRISNFMLWQLAYSELYFSDKMFPDFDGAELVQALTQFQRRERRFGGHKY